MRKQIIKFISQKISFNIIAQRGIPYLSFKIPFYIILFLFIIIISGTFLFLKMSIFYTDYVLTKLDNELMQNKIISLATKAEYSLKYLDMSKRADNQIKKIIGLNNFNQSSNYIGGPSKVDIETFKNILSKKAKDINENYLIKAYQEIKDKSKERISDFSQLNWYITNKYNLSKAIPKGWPTKGNITSGYGYRNHPLRFLYEFHTGVDISNIQGTIIKSTADGIVRFCGWQQGYGLSALIDHGFGYSTLYGHMSEILVKENEKILRGEIIGKMGTTGTSTGPHLHYEVWENGRTVNPVKYIENKDPKIANVFLFENIIGN